MFKRVLWCGLLLWVASCERSQTVEIETVDPSESISIIAYGDSGYHPDYLQKKYFRNPHKTPEDFAAAYRSRWEKTGRPSNEIIVPDLEYHKASGGYIPKSGLYPVANAMTSYCQTNKCDFALMLGDNIYPDGATLGADGIDDATRFRDLLTLPFANLGKDDPDFKIYTTLGNHDWHTSREAALAQVSFIERDPKFYMEGLFYSVLPPAGKGQVELFIIDTEMLLTMTPVKRARLNKDSSEMAHEDYLAPRASAVPQTKQEKAMVDWLEQSLRASSARWKIVVGHHPMWSAGGAKFEQARAVRRLVRPLVCRYADAYLAGHEHTLEVYEDSCEDMTQEVRRKKLLHVVSGAAGKQRSVHGPFLDQQNRSYPQRRVLFAKGMVWGFARLTLSASELGVEVYTTNEKGRFERELYRTY